MTPTVAVFKYKLQSTGTYATLAGPRKKYTLSFAGKSPANVMGYTCMMEWVEGIGEITTGVNVTRWFDRDCWLAGISVSGYSTYSLRCFQHKNNYLLTGCFTGVKEKEQLMAGMNLWPNPATDQVMLELPDGTMPVKIELLDLCGRSIMITQTLSGIKNTTLDVRNIENGSYFLRITSGEFNYTKELLIRRD